MQRAPLGSATLGGMRDLERGVGWSIASMAMRQQRQLAGATLPVARATRRAAPGRYSAGLVSTAHKEAPIGEFPSAPRASGLRIVGRRRPDTAAPTRSRPRATAGGARATAKIAPKMIT